MNIQKIDIDKRILETKKQTENLKIELQSLIDAGLKSSVECIKSEAVKVEKYETTLCDYKHIQCKQGLCSKESNSKSNIEVDSQNFKEIPKNIRLQDLNDAQNIKKQRGTFLQPVRSHKDEKIKAELHKQKLLQLHKKSLELVRRNIQAKQQKSKLLKKIDLVEQEKTVECNESGKEAYRQNRSHSNVKKNNDKAKTSRQSKNVELQTVEQTGSKLLTYELQERLLKAKMIKKGSNSNPIKKQIERSIPNTLCENDVSKNVCGENVKKKPLDMNLHHLPFSKAVVDVAANTQKMNCIPDSDMFDYNYDQRSNQQPNIILENFKDAQFASLVSNLRESKDAVSSRIIHNNYLEISEPSTVATKIENSNRKTKETQTNNKELTQYPIWLEEKPAQVYPLNFINTVKRKLQDAIKHPKKFKEALVDNSTDKDDIIGLSQHQHNINMPSSDMKSFNSLRSVNLDSKVYTNSPMIPPKYRTQTLVSASESESATSKNIPEISSESSATIIKSSCFYNQNSCKLNTDRINNMVLTPHKVKSNISLLENGEKAFNPRISPISINSALQNCSPTESTGTKCLEVENQYACDFQSESDICNSFKSRLSYNSPSYNNLVNNSVTSSDNPKLSKSKNMSHLEKYSHGPEHNINTKNTKNISMLLAQYNESRMFDNNTNLGNLINTSENKAPLFKKGYSNNTLEDRELGPSISFSSNITERHPLKESTLLLSVSKKTVEAEYETKEAMMKNDEINISLHDNTTILGNLDSSDTINLKFEAEIDLLNDFNQSFQQFSTVDEAFKSLKSEDTQWAQNNKISKSQDIRSNVKISETNNISLGSKRELPTINYSRGCNMRSRSHSYANSQLDACEDVPEGIKSNNISGLSLRMFEQLIKDEDLRLENLKTILKIREHALLNRTKGELACLELQKKYLRENGKLQEASLIKKKQRGILVNHQKEKYEMHRLKEMEKSTSIERKNILREQKSFIKHQLSTNKVFAKIKVYTPRKLRVVGPFKVNQYRPEPIGSEISKNINVREKLCNEVRVHKHSSTKHTTRCSDGLPLPSDVLVHVNSEDSNCHTIRDREINVVHIQSMKKTLITTEAALKRRRRAVEDLLKWHRKLSEEERRISELEAIANIIISQASNNSTQDQIYAMSHIPAQCLCNRNHLCREKSPKLCSDTETASKLNKQRISDNVQNANGNIAKTKHSINLSRSHIELEEHKSSSSKQNMDSSDLGIQSVNRVDNIEDFNVLESSINQLINNFCTIKNDLSLLGMNKSVSASESSLLLINKELRGMAEDHRKNESNPICHSQINDTIEDSSENHKFESEDKVTVVIKKDFNEFPNILIENKSLNNKEDTSKCKEIPSDTPQAGLINSTSNELSVQEINRVSNMEEDNVQVDLVDHARDNSSIKIFEDISIDREKVLDEPLCPKNTPNCFKEDVNVDEELPFDENTQIAEINKDEITSGITHINVEDDQNDINTESETTNFGGTVPDNFITKSPTAAKTESITELDENSEIFDYRESHFKLNPSSALLWKDTLNTKESIDLYEKDNHEYNSMRIADPLPLSPVSTIEQAAATVKELLDVSNQNCLSIERYQEDVKKQVSEITDPLKSAGEEKHLEVDHFSTHDASSTLVHSTKSGSPADDGKLVTAGTIIGTEAEEILKKQLAIEQEIKKITEEQQKEQLPLLFARGIPNKPPPPYTPPSSMPPANINTIVPTSKEIEKITKYSAKILHKAYLSNNLDTICISENTLSLVSKDITKECYKFVFDLSKEIAKEHSTQFQDEICTSWLQVNRKPQLAAIKPLHINGLENQIHLKLEEIFQYKVPESCETSILKWNQKRRDHVDEILVAESLTEESAWTNYDKDELYVMSEITEVIMSIVVKETIDVYVKILTKIS